VLGLLHAVGWGGLGSCKSGGLRVWLLLPPAQSVLLNPLQQVADLCVRVLVCISISPFRCRVYSTPPIHAPNSPDGGAACSH
jgi:hypothetical protein